MNKELSDTDILIYLMKAPREFTDADSFIKGCLKISISHYQLAQIRSAVAKLVK